MNLPPSPALVRSAVAGDETALVCLLEAVRPDIRRYAKATCRAADIDDAVQDSLLLLYRRVGSLRAVSAFPAWLFAVVRRTCLRLARRLGALPAGHEAGPEFLSRPDEALRRALAAAIQSLPPHYRAIVVMRDLEECTVDEMAAALGLSREAVKGRLHRARNLLREHLLR